MVTMEIIIGQTDRLCYRDRERATEKEREEKTRGEEQRKKTVGGKVAEMFVGIPQPGLCSLGWAGKLLKRAGAGMWHRLNPIMSRFNKVITQHLQSGFYHPFS